ncbi:MAG TPA: amino acid adenylation domain-containing protein [Nitrospira sp.]|nr:amino acid adenylation domain-containing protein [Nitrospira sp.]
MTQDDVYRRIASLSLEQQDRLSRLLRQRGVHNSVGRIPPRASDRPPLSHGQRRLWFLAQIAPDSPNYNVPMATRLTGMIDADLLARSITAVVDRHEGLRTTFAIGADDEPYQVVHEHMEIPLPVIDLVTTDSDDGFDSDVRLPGIGSRAYAEMVRMAKLPFDLHTGPLVRMALLRQADDNHILVAIMHHIIVDTWSVGIILRELSQCYEALASGQTVPFEGVPTQYPDYAEWQRTTLTDGALERELNYWKEQLSGGLDQLDLPFDRPRPRDPAWTGAKHVAYLPARLGSAVDSACERFKVTPFTLFLAALQTLIHRYTGETQVRIGSAVANRDRPELADIVGYLSNTVVMVTDLSGSPSFAEVLRRTHLTTTHAQMHQNVPFDMVVDAIAPDRRGDSTPLIQVFMLLEQSAQPTSSPALGQFAEAIPIDNATAKFDLQFSIEPNRGTYRVEVEYSTELFDATTIRRLTRHFEVIIGALLDDPERGVSEISLMPTDERANVVRDWNQTDAPYPADRCLHELFGDQAERTPDAVALIDSRDDVDVTLTYRELDQLSDTLAVRLQALGAGPDIPIAIAAPKTIKTVVGLIAILKAGSAYLPVDPDYPDARIDHMLADADPPVLLTTAALSERWEGRFAGHVVVLDEPETAPCTTGPKSAVQPDNLAYLIYTSGSTGTPKGVLLPHRGRVNNFFDFIRRFEIGPGDAVLAVSSLSFDMSAFDIIGTLMSGATVVLADAAERNPELWIDLIAKHKVTVWHSVPALLQMLTTHLEGEASAPDTMLRSLRLALLGGDWIPVDLPKRLTRLAPGVCVVSLGGATEVSMDSTIYVIDDVDVQRTSIPYGKPMANQRCYVLDQNRHPVPIGVVGDLYLGGVGVGRGYKNLPELTAERFLDNVLPEDPDTLYRTGDLCRYLNDGNLQLLGRSDHQVKIHGWRIEPGEVEGALLCLPNVAEAVVTAPRSATGVRQLVAYVVPAKGDTVAGSQLRATLEKQLPSYLVPVHFIELEKLPLNANGKVDRQALPDPAGAAEPAASYIPPTSPVQQAMVDVWMSLLPESPSPLGIRDNFFRRGGDSIMVIQMVSRLRRRGITVAPAAVFQQQTIEALEAFATSVETTSTVSAASWKAPASVWESLENRVPGLVDAYPTTGMQAWMCDQLARRPVAGLYIIQADYLFSDGGLDPVALELAWSRVIARHPILRTTFHHVGPDHGDPRESWLQAVAGTTDFAIENVDLRTFDTESQVRAQHDLVHSIRRDGFALDHGPLLRVHLLRIGDDQYKYICSNHHIIMDGWSRAIVQQEVFAEYESLLAGDVPPERAQRPFRDYAVWQAGMDLTQARDFFTNYLRGSEPTPLLRAVGRAGATCTGAFRKYREQFGYDQELARFCRAHAPITANTVFQAAWFLAMARNTGRSDLVLGVTSSGRSPDFDGVDTLTGVCMNTLPVRIRLDPRQRIDEWLADLQALQVDLREYEYTPLSSITAWAGRAPGDAPFETMMVFENYPWDGSLQNLADRIEVDHPLAQPDFQWAQFEWPLRVEVAPGGSSLMIMHYYADAFDDATIASLLSEWRQNLLRIIADPERPIAQLASV